jgi:ureidoglycolate amidohydrolase
MRARGYVKQLMGEAGLTIREDTMGNIYGVLPGANPGAAAVGTGSHCDAIPLAGAYDGTLGTLAECLAGWAGCLRSLPPPADCLASRMGC